ncbi:MAG: hypothetical protein ALECFALPRED_003327 [Alectoria fallacina]|uniref:histone acetyltransferase n=1 Tax=Alectoria fallacina TaxID=1903189 RepID=A0A8H3IBI4_9LECA|nr:MAG: hypothetical protein ALECFALPRED_003327 [Alectoria fallacina]
MGSLSVSTNALASPLATHRNKEKPADLNVRNVVLGDILFKTWYPSFYPEELVGRELERLFVCQLCFKYSKDLMPYLAHTKVCALKHEGPPGRPIYSRDLHAIYEVDGEEHQLFAQNLSLFAKLFLDNKSIFFDVSSFDYYLLVHIPNSTSSHHPQIVGFFSKEKMSWDNNNLACILVFPPWQRKGLGKILMGVSYELSRRENRLGGPEKPLSELGRKGYMRFWEARVARAILEVKAKRTLSVGELAEACWVLPEDVVGTLKDMRVLTASKRADGAAVISKAKLREYVLNRGLDPTPPISEEGFLDKWVPGPGEGEV